MRVFRGRLHLEFANEETDALRVHGASCDPGPPDIGPGLEPEYWAAPSVLCHKPKPPTLLEDFGHTHWCTVSCHHPRPLPPLLLVCRGKKSLRSLIHEAHFLYCHHIQSQQLALVLFLEGPKVLLL